MQFREVIGHKELKKKLIQSLSQGRIPHAQLYYGPEGSGKLALALAYAQFLNCKNRQPEDSCGSCPSCLQFQKLAHPDLHFIYPVATTAEIKEKPKSLDFIQQWRNFLISCNYYINLNGWYEAIEIERKQGIINKDDCNEIVRSLGYKTYESEYKIMVIWMVEKLFHAAAPKILKILEEPPDKTIFFLITENIDQILPTIISRTQLVKVPKINDFDLSEQLKALPGTDDIIVRKAVNMANGNYLEAIRYLQQREEEESHFSGFRNWMLLCYKNNIADLSVFIEEYAKFPRERLKSFLNYGIYIYRYCFHIHVLESPNIRLEGKELEFVFNFSKFVHPCNTGQLFQLLNEAIYHIERNANTPILLMDLSLQIGKLLRITAPQKSAAINS